MQGASPNSVYQAAASYVSAGISVVPIKLDGSKTAAIKWKEYQSRLPDWNELHSWFGGSQPMGIAAVCGAVSGNLECIDLDDGKLFDAWRDAIQKERLGLTDSLCVVRTPRKPSGFHAWYRCTAIEIPGNEKLALERVNGKTVTLIETRGEGGYALLPGSPTACHPDGGTYELMPAGTTFTAISDLSAVDRQLLVDTARLFDKSNATPVASKKGHHGADRPGDDYALRGPDWSEILEPHGWKCLSSHGGVRVWKRPGKNAPGGSATTGVCHRADGAEYLYVFSSNADPFNRQRGNCFTKFQAFALLEHGGDFKAAARALESSNYGQQDNGINATRNGVPVQPAHLNGSLKVLKNYRELKVANNGHDEVTVKQGLPIETIYSDLTTLTGGWPKRVGEMLFAPDAKGKPTFLRTDQQIFAWIGGRLGGSCSAVRWAKGEDKVTQAQFSAYLAQRPDEYSAVEEYPHHPAMQGHYYMHPEPVFGSRKLLDLLNRFQAATLVDRDLILAFFLTQVWGGVPGRRPGFLFTTEMENDSHMGRGAGKTAVAKAAARLFGGMIHASTNDSLDDLKTRMLTPGAINTRIVLVDNIKSFKLSWAEMEALITSNVVSGHRMYYGEAQRPNTITYVLTINGASLSRDLAQRVVPVCLKRPKYSADWEEATYALIDKHRWEIIGDLIEILREPAPKLSGYSRWGSWEAEVLSHVVNPAACQRLIAERQDTYDEDQAEADIVAEAFRRQLTALSHDPDTCCVLIPSFAAARWVNRATNELNRSVQRASNYLGSLSIEELRKSDRKGQRMWLWTGTKAQHGVAPIMFDQYSKWTD